MDPMTICNNFIDRILSGIRNLLTAELFEKTESAINGLSKIATPICAVVGALIAIILAIKIDSLVMFLAAFGWVFFVILLYYIGSKLQNTCQSTIRNNPFSIASQELIDTFIAVYCVVAIISFILGFYISIKASDFYPLLYGTIASLITIYFVWILLHPHLVTTYVEASSSAGLDAIAYFSLGNKMFLRTNKLLFGLLPSIAAILLIRSLFKVFGEPGEIMHGGIQGAIGFVLLIVGLLSPFLAYLVFIVSYMLLDVMRSILIMGAAASQSLGGAAAKPSYSPPPPPADSGGGATGSQGQMNVSPTVLRNVGIGAVVLFVVIFVGIKGQEFYKEYQEKAEAQRVEEARKKAEEEEKKAKEEAEKAKADAEKQKFAGFLANVRKHIGKPALDLVLEPEVNRKFKEIFGSNLAAYENYFSDSGSVVEGNGLIVGQGCIKATCDNNKALVVVDVNTGEVYTAVVNGATSKFYGVSEENVSPEVKKWVMSTRK